MFISFDDAITYKHLLKSYNHCRKGKKFRAASVKYHMNYQINLFHLLQRLKDGTYRIEKLYSFTIYEPKKREITANQLEDKIVHRLICKYVLEPIIGPKLIYDNYASQPGKGTHKAVKRLVHNMRSFSNITENGIDGYVLVCDIHKYFYSINREICYQKICELPIDKRILEIIRHQIYATEDFDNSTKGLCIGFQSSQWMAIYYLDGLDHFIKEKLRIKYYGRYMDDFYLIHKSKEYLEYCYKKIEEYVREKLDLEMNPKSHIHQYSQGICYLGYHCTFNAKTHDIDIAIRSVSINRMKKRTKRQVKLIQEERITVNNGLESLESWNSFAKYGYTNKAKNAYNEAKELLQGYEYELSYDHLYGDNDIFDADGFIKLRYKSDFRDKDGFIKLRPRNDSVYTRPMEVKYNKYHRGKDMMKDSMEKLSALYLL
jgi:RNA-directed DNA polymerase (reverse transcriptase)